MVGVEIRIRMIENVIYGRMMLAPTSAAKGATFAMLADKSLVRNIRYNVNVP
jgi:hypothetical protein